jgi:fructose 1,6-bisphosphatase
MSTYPVDIKTVNIVSATSTTIFDGPARILGLSWVVPSNVAVGTITVLDDTTAIWVVNTPATNTTDHKTPSHGSIMLPGTGIRANTSLEVTNSVVTHVTVYYG